MSWTGQVSMCVVKMNDIQITVQILYNHQLFNPLPTIAVHPKDAENHE